MMTLPNEFTTTQFIELTGLKVDIADPHATRIIAQKLREEGYTKKTKRIDGKNKSVWYKKGMTDEVKSQIKTHLDSVFR